MHASPTPPGKLHEITLLLLFVLPLSLAMAAPTKNAYFGENTTPNIIALLPMPPDIGAREESADRESSLAVYNARTPEQIALGKSQNKLTVFHYSRVLGSWLEKGKLPKTDALFTKLDREVTPFVDSAKKYFQRPHPAQVDSGHFKEVISKPETGSYPSGHATRASLYAIILLELIPNQRAAILAQGREMGWLRVIGGVETPLDVFAGRVFGHTLAQSLMHNPDFLTDLEEIRAEITTAIAPPSPAVPAK